MKNNVLFNLLVICYIIKDALVDAYPYKLQCDSSMDPGARIMAATLSYSAYSGSSASIKATQVSNGLEIIDSYNPGETLKIELKGGRGLYVYEATGTVL